MTSATARTFIAAMLAIVVLEIGLAANSFATIQGGMCWEPDVEFPVPCADAGED